MTTKHQLFAVEQPAESGLDAQTSVDDPIRLLATAIFALARADCPIGIEEVAAICKCTVDTILRTPVEQLPRSKVGREALFFKHEVLQFIATFRRVQPKSQNPLASPQRRRPSFDSDGGRGREPLKGKAS